MGTDKRERKKANRAAKLAAEHAAATKARRVRTIRNVVTAGIVLVAVMILISALSGCSTSGDDATATTAANERAAGSEDVTGEPSGRDRDPADEVACATAPDGVRVIEFDDPPTTELDPTATYVATFATSEGTVVAELDTERTPDTTANFVALAEHCYFHGTDLFRTELPSGVIQGGAPRTQDNSDPGPGYTIDDEGGRFTADDYGPGALAMARTAAPDSASGQFFFLASENGRYLGDPDALGEAAGSYVKFGQVTEGLDVLEAIVALDDGRSSPTRPVTVDAVTISTR
jgi:peptidyl-prolyl cis-trans isomerase B (cyclophilin B)